MKNSEYLGLKLILQPKNKNSNEILCENWKFPATPPSSLINSVFFTQNIHGLEELWTERSIILTLTTQKHTHMIQPSVMKSLYKQTHTHKSLHNSYFHLQMQNILQKFHLHTECPDFQLRCYMSI